MTLSVDQIRTLAPDAAAAKAGEGLGDARHWTGLGRSDAGAWGLCKGSGSSPYQVAADLGGPAFSCSCPSRKIPCKHALGLLFLVAGGSLPATEPPDWAGAWFEARAARATAATARAEAPAAPTSAAPADPAARAKREEARERKVQAGLVELDRWLEDLLRGGLDRARTAGYEPWETMGARLVDAQAAGLARAVRALASAANAGDAWPGLLLDGIGRVHLVAEAYRRADRLPPPLAADVRSLIGWTIREDDLELAGGEPVEDRWLVIGGTVDDAGQVLVARTTLVGERTGRFALHLAFGIEVAPPSVLAWPGRAIRGTLVFHPSATPLRVAARPGLASDGEVRTLPAPGSLAAIVAAHAARLAVNPFIDAWPVVVGPVVPVLRGERLLVREADGSVLPVEPVSLAADMLAASGGCPVMVVGTWDGHVLRPLSLLGDDGLVRLAVEAGGSAAEPVSEAGWARLVSAALVGTERTGGDAAVPDAVAPVAHGTPERRLLAAAAATSVRRRAGRQIGRDDRPAPTPAPADPRPVLGDDIADLVLQAIDAPRPVGQEALDLLAASGRRLADPELPGLLTLAGEVPAFGPAILSIVGPRGAWLVDAVPDFIELRSARIAAARTDPTDGDGSAADTAFDAATSAAGRRDALRALRAEDRAAAADLLVRRLPQVAPDERASLLELLGPLPGPDDEPVLARALGDRRGDVRRMAASLLARLPGSAFARAVEERARPLLVMQGRLRPGLGIVLPDVTEALAGLGLDARPPAGIGERAWAARQLLAHLPPARWVEWLHEDVATLVDRALRGSEARPILDGWLEAAIRFADVDWATALLSTPGVLEVTGRDVATVVGALASAAHGPVVARLAPGLDIAMLSRVAATVAGPWTPVLTDAVIAAIAVQTRSDAPSAVLPELARTAAIGVTADRAELLASVLVPAIPARRGVAAAVDLLRFRSRLHASFASLPPLPPEVNR